MRPDPIHLLLELLTPHREGISLCQRELVIHQNPQSVPCEPSHEKAPLKSQGRGLTTLLWVRKTKLRFLRPTAMPIHLPLSVVIISLNEEERIGSCLASVRGLTNDVVLVDAESTDRTAEIASGFGARVFTRAWKGYSAQKNHGNDTAIHDWILSLDADEQVTPELAASIRAEFARGPRFDAYDLRFQNYFGGVRVRFGSWNPESHVRLFDRRKFEWNCDEVHEGLGELETTRVGTLRGRIRHDTVASHAQLAAKTQRYSALFADKLRRQRRHPAWWKVWLNPGFRFVRDYFFRAGMFDGRAGFAIAWEAARYTYLKYALALPEPGVRAETPWWRATTVTAMVALIATLSIGGRRETSERFAGANHATLTLLASLEVDDGFDNNPMVPSNRGVDDDEVLS